MIVETGRLSLRKLQEEDYPALCKILRDKDVMYAYEHPFTREEAWEWLGRQMGRYERYGFGLWAVILKETGELIGQAGITMQDAGGCKKPEIGYLFQKAFWHQGYAIEAARACKQYGFEVLGFTELCSIIRDNNLPSQAVARKNGMRITGRHNKHYYNIDMPHDIWSVQKETSKDFLSSIVK